MDGRGVPEAHQRISRRPGRATNRMNERTPTPRAYAAAGTGTLNAEERKT
jgi:hypothetical protein